MFIPLERYMQCDIESLTWLAKLGKGAHQTLASIEEEDDYDNMVFHVVFSNKFMYEKIDHISVTLKRT